jgi:hypothetical protein
MRYVLAIFLACFIGTLAAFATPQISSGTTLVGEPASKSRHLTKYALFVESVSTITTGATSLSGSD